ncbi:hypothetical protein LTR95_014458 [Oleoguttula sp. CCFEE 5521]
MSVQLIVSMLQQLEDPAELAIVLEALRDMQVARNGFFEAARFKIQRMGLNEAARIPRFFEYLGPDAQTLRVLTMNAGRWTQDPLSFWKNPLHPTMSATPSGQIVELYMKARCDDA